MLIVFLDSIEMSPFKFLVGLVPYILTGQHLSPLEVSYFNEIILDLFIVEAILSNSYVKQNSKIFIGNGAHI